MYVLVNKILTFEMRHSRYLIIKKDPINKDQPIKNMFGNAVQTAFQKNFNFFC
jgi:hypothetical protein